MALSNTTNRYETGTLSGIGVGYTVATWSSRISAESDLKVYVVESDGTTTLLALDVDYEIDPTLSGTLITSCNIKAKDADKFPDGSSVIVIRETDFLQASDYATNGVILSDTLENDLDKLAMQTQQLKDDITRSVRFSASLLESETPDPEISFDAAARSNKVLGFDADGDFAVTQELGTFVGDWTDGTDYQTRDIVRTWGSPDDKNYGSVWIAKQSHTASTGNAPDNTYPLASNDYWELILDTGHFATQAGLAELSSTTSTGKATEAQDWANKTNGDVEVDEVASGEYSAKAYAIGGTGVTSVAGKGSAKEWAIGGGPTFDVDTMVDGLSYSAKYWATREDVGTVAGLDTEIQAVAAIDSAVSTVSTNINNVNEVATDLLGDNNIGTVATNIANVNLVGPVSGNVTTVATNIANVNTVAGVSANVTTVAGVSADVTSVAGVSTEVATVADNIANVNTVATGIADVNRYADEYTISATEPASPSEGDLWYDSTNNALKVYTGTAWAVIEAVPQPLATTDSPTFAGITAGTADINGGTIDGADITVGSGKTLDVSAGTLTLANDQISGNAINGGTIGSITITSLNTDTITAGDGSVASPSFCNAGDTNTGIYFPEDNAVGLVAGGGEQMRIDVNGNVRAAKFTNLAGTGAPDFPQGLTLAGNAISGNITGVTLDDYEEGTWTPSVILAGNIISLTFSDARYVKVGSLVMLTYEVSGTIASSIVETYFSFYIPFHGTSNTYSEIGSFAGIVGLGANRFAIGTAYRGTAASNVSNIFIPANQMNNTGTITGRMTLVYQAA